MHGQRLQTAGVQTNLSVEGNDQNGIVMMWPCRSREGDILGPRSFGQTADKGVKLFLMSVERI